MIPTYAAYNPYISSASKLFGVDPRLINGVIALESGGRSGLTSPTGAVGVMQVQPTTYDALAKRHGFGADAADDENNILAGTAYLSEQMKANNGDWAKTLAAYNAGPGGSAKFRQTGDYAALPQETRQYLQRAAQMGLLDPTAAPPVEVAARKPAQPLTATSTQSATTANGVAAMPDTPAQPAMPAGLLSTDDGKTQMLLALGSGLLSGRNWAEGIGAAGQNALQAMDRAKQQQALNGMRAMQIAELQQKQTQRAAQMKSAETYAAKLEGAGKGDLAAAIRGNPSLMDEIVKEQAKTSFQGGLFPTTSVEGIALNNLVKAGKLTPEQAMMWGAGRPFTGPNGQVVYATPDMLGFGAAPAQGGQSPAAGTPAAGPQTLIPAQAKDVPEGINQAMLGNMSALRNVDAAIEALNNYPGAVGPDIGIANKLPADAVNYYDPKGTDARSKIAKVAGEKVHDLSGAAVSPTEFARLKPFIPEMGDSPDTAKTKLKNFKAELENILQDQYRSYGADAGYKGNATVGEFLKGRQPKAAGGASPSTSDPLGLR